MRHYNFGATQTIDWRWDPAKERLNRSKHRLSLAAAVPVFLDALATSRRDPDSREERWQTIGSAGDFAVVIVIHTEPVRQPDGRMVGRIISVRKATRHERKAYEEGAF